MAVTFADETVPEPLIVLHICAVGCVLTVTEYAVWLASDVGKVNDPVLDTVSE
jgi:hypothetical protein